MKDRLYPYSDATTPERLRWALDGDAAMPVPLTRPMRRLVPVCRNYWRWQWYDTAYKPQTKRPELYREIASMCEQITALVEYRYGETIGAYWIDAADRAREQHGYPDIHAKLFDVIAEAERETYRTVLDAGDCIARARVRPGRANSE